MPIERIDIDLAAWRLEEIVYGVRYGNPDDVVLISASDGTPLVEMRPVYDADRRYLDRTDAELAQLALDHDEAAAKELHRRHPHLAGFHSAAQFLQRAHTEAFWAARGGFDPWSNDGPGDSPPGYDKIIDGYTATLHKMTEAAKAPQPEQVTP